MRLPEALTTERLLLRKPKPEDAAAMFAGWTQDADVTRFLTWRPHDSVAKAESFVSAAIAGWSGDQRSVYVIAQRNRAEAPIGLIEVRFEPSVAASIGYVLQRADWNQGVMTEAARTVVEHVLALPEIWRVWAFCDVENVGSARVLERCGMQREGVVRSYVIHPNISDVPRDVYLYARVR